MRIALGIFLNRFGDTMVRVALTKHRVDGRAKDGRVASVSLLLSVGRWDRHIVRNIVTVTLELRDGGSELRNRSRDVRKLDQVGLAQPALSGRSRLAGLPGLFTRLAGLARAQASFARLDLCGRGRSLCYGGYHV